VNDVPIKDKALQNGDKIQVGDILFTLMLDSDVPGCSSSPVSLDDNRLVTLNFVRLSPEESLFLRGDRAPQTASAASARVAHDLNALLKISTNITSAQTVDNLQDQLLDSVLDVVPAEQASILLVGADEEWFDSSVGRDRRAPGKLVQPSRTIVHKVLRDGTAMLSRNILAEGSLSVSDSLVQTQTRSVICAPLQALGRKMGVLYLATGNPDSDFDEGHLQWVTAVCSIAAVGLQNCRQLEFLRSENQRLQEEVNLNHNMVGESPAMRHVYQLIGKVAPVDSTVLITGESGTGKELVARAIHQNSPRRANPLVAINCAAIPEALLESELFGCEKGAYTGAQQRRGKLEAAAGGTVFLDEIGDLPLPLQAKFLRVLQERQFERLGGHRTIPANVRWIAATNRDLKQAVQGGTFREDLYFRLQVIAIRMPPLRERSEDISLLANYFVAKYSKACGRAVKGISLEARAQLVHYEWPGNVRELENAIERAIVLGSTELLLWEDLNKEVLERGGSPGVVSPKYHEAVRQAKRKIVHEALDRVSGNMSEAARHLGIHPNNLHRLIRNLGLRSTGQSTDDRPA